MKVLLGIEGSEESMRTLEATIERTRDAGDELTVAVFEKPDTDQSLDEIEATVRDRLEGAGLDAVLERIEADHPASALVQRAEAGGFDQLVIGGGTRSPMGKISLGEVTEFVLLNAQITVRVVR